MKIEFRKVPLQASEFEINSDSVKFSGTFSKISSKLAKINANLNGKYEVDCCKCGQSYHIEVNEDIDFLVSDGIYSSKDNNDDEEYVVIEIEDHILDFDEVLRSELESLKSEYHICDTCKTNDEFVELEY